ncbi:putative quinol monooxygenase [Sphaerisporangium perillae]|uniref:putative quinol monooxygenase n=1 Tax=Sphaerisporangium perillae TaxID=2935860 RepID=UPI00200CA78D|nr:putative quinol monooxygenase [Sphaerisporangium perillae]
MSIVVVATLEAVPGHRDELLGLVTELVSKVHTEQGCHLYAPHTSGEDQIVVIEHWADEQALAAHRTQPHMRAFRTAVAGLMAGPSRIQVLRPVPAGDPQRGRLEP